MKIPQNQRKVFVGIAIIQILGGLSVLIPSIFSISDQHLLISALFGIAISLFSILAGIAGLLGYWQAFALTKWCQWLQIFQIAVGPFRWMIVAGPALLMGAGVIEDSIVFTFFDFQLFGHAEVGNFNQTELVQLKINLIPFILIHFNAVIRNRAIDTLNAAKQSSN